MILRTSSLLNEIQDQTIRGIRKKNRLVMVLLQMNLMAIFDQNCVVNMEIMLQVQHFV